MEFTVWHRTDGKHGQNNGKLTVGDDGTVTYEDKHGTVAMSPILMLGHKKIGAYGQSWVALQYLRDGQPTNAYFTDRRMLGWKGMLGGNTAITDALRAAAPDAPAAPPAGPPIPGAPTPAAAPPPPPAPPPAG
jgi:hypothetical protein